MEKPYTKLAKYYDLIYDFKNYKKESEIIVNLIQKYKKTKGNNLLDAGCGTGKYLKYLNSKYNCEGFDLSSDMIEIAKSNFPEIKFTVDDMTNFSFNIQYDIIICLFSSIGYLQTLSNVKKTISNFSKHTKKGGIIIIESWLSPKDFIEGIPDLITYENNNIRIAKMEIGRVVDEKSILDMQYLIAEKDKDTIYLKDKHIMGLFEHSQIVNIMKEKGFRTKIYKYGIFGKRVLFIGIKR